MAQFGGSHEVIGKQDRDRSQAGHRRRDHAAGISISKLLDDWAWHGTAAVWLARLLGHFLYDVWPADPLTLATVCTLLIAVAAVASYVPALAASRSDPSKALRYE